MALLHFNGKSSFFPSVHYFWRFMHFPLLVPSVCPDPNISFYHISTSCRFLESNNGCSSTYKAGQLPVHSFSCIPSLFSSKFFLLWLKQWLLLKYLLWLNKRFFIHLVCEEYITQTQIFFKHIYKDRFLALIFSFFLSSLSLHLSFLLYFILSFFGFVTIRFVFSPVFLFILFFFFLQWDLKAWLLRNL